jgi:hypothetical protein
MDIVDRIDSCQSFAEGYYPHQALMERLYLIYQVLRSQELLRSEVLCRRCREWPNRIALKSAEPRRLSHGNT